MTKSRLQLSLLRAEHLFSNLENVSEEAKKYISGLHKAISLVLLVVSTLFS